VVAISLTTVFNLGAFLVFVVAVATAIGEELVRPGGIDVLVIHSALVADVAFGLLLWRLQLPLALLTA
jgi:hypothetical protein